MVLFVFDLKENNYIIFDEYKEFKKMGCGF